MFCFQILRLCFNIQWIQARRFLRNLLSVLKLENRFMFWKNLCRLGKKMWESTCVKLCIQVEVKIWKISVHIPRRRFLGCNQGTSIQKPWNISSQWRFKNHENGWREGLYINARKRPPKLISNNIVLQYPDPKDDCDGCPLVMKMKIRITENCKQNTRHKTGSQSSSLQGGREW